MQGKTHTEAWAAVKAVFWSVLVKNWIIWGIAQYINLSYVPTKVCMQNLCVCACVRVCVCYIITFLPFSCSIAYCLLT